MHFDRRDFDVLVIGGGIHGACVAWEASTRGLTVALVEKSDFASATSANSLKIIHGGLRYLQHLDIKRLRESTRERTILMNIAPHLVHPLPVIIPTYGHGVSGKEVMSAALALNHLLSADCKRSWDPDKAIPWGRVIPRKEIEVLLPNIPRRGLTGGAMFYDAQVYNSERLVLSFLHSASQHGAVLANYLEVQGFLKGSTGIAGVIVKDVLSEASFEIRSKIVVNTAGPWVGELLEKLNGKIPVQKTELTKAMNIVVDSTPSSYAFGVSASWNYGDDRAVMKRSKRMLFIAPWRDHSIIGTTYTPFQGKANDLRVSKEEVEVLINSANQACPGLDLSWNNIKFVHSGLLPCTHVGSDMREPQLSAHFQIRDYRKHGLGGLISVVGVKYTTARLVAQHVLNRVCAIIAPKQSVSKTDHMPVYGGTLPRFQPFVEKEFQKAPPGIARDAFVGLLRNYGNAYHKVLQCLEGWVDGRQPRMCKEFDVLKAQIRFAVREEMAQKLPDVVFRRTDIGSVGNPGTQALEVCAREMGRELKWSEQRIAQEILETQQKFVFAA